MNEGVYVLKDALQLMQEGKAMTMIDNGKGFILPGIVMIVPYNSLVSMLEQWAIPKQSTIAQLLGPLVNIIQLPDGRFIIRFYTTGSFEANSTWIIAEAVDIDLAKQAMSTSTADDTDDEGDEDDSSKIIPFTFKPNDYKS